MNNPTAEQLRVSHTPAAVSERLRQRVGHSYLRDFVYGGIDGAVTTFAVVSGVAGAELSSEIVIVLGLANLAGDGFSMAAANLLGSRAEKQLVERARAAEKHQIETYPEGEREEIRQILAGKGFRGEDLERAVEIITSDRELWVETMLREELQLSVDCPNPFHAALTTFVSFVLIGFLPLVAFLLEYASIVDRPYLLSAIMTGIAFFTVGAIKSRFVAQHWALAGLETLSVGGTAAILAYSVGALLANVVNAAPH